MILTEVVPRTLRAFDPGTDDGREFLRALYARKESSYVRLNMIASLTGSAAGSDGTSDTLTSSADRAVLGVIRRDADVVVVGAQSVRAEGYAVPRSARLAIVTTSGDLSGHDLAPRAEGPVDRVLVLCPAGRAASLTDVAAIPGVTVVPVAGDGPLAPATIVAALHRRGLRRIVCEGGPGLASQFASAGLIDEYCVTVAPVLSSVSGPFLDLVADTAPRTAVAGQLVDDAGFSYLRLRRV